MNGGLARIVLLGRLLPPPQVEAGEGTAPSLPHRPTVALVLICVLTASAVPVASGLGPVTTVVATGPIDSVDKKQVVATCPPGMIAFAGGGLGNPEISPFSGRLAVVYSSSINSPPNEWLVMVQEVVATDQSWRVEAQALCAEIPGYEKVSAGAQASGGDVFKTVTVSCPQGMTVIGGGGSVIAFPSDRVLISANHPYEDGWRTQAMEVEPTSSQWLVGVMASCAPGRDLDVEVIDARIASQQGQQQYLTVSCASDRTTIGGGWSVVGDTVEGVVGGSRTLSPLTAWFVNDAPLTGVGYFGLTVHALCVSSRLFTDGFETGDTSMWSLTTR